MGTSIFAGVLADGASSKLAFAKVGDGVFTLSGANTFTGATTVSSGTLELRGAATIIPAGSTITIAPAATLLISNANAGTTLAAPLAGTGTVRLDNNISGTAGAQGATLTGNNVGFTGTLLIQPSGTFAANGTMRLSSSTPSQLGGATVVVKDRGQAYLTSATFANNFVITGLGFADTTNYSGTSAAVLGFGSAYGLGAIRIDGATLTGNVRIDGNAKINSYSNTGILTGVISSTNASDVLVLGGQGTANSTLRLLGNNTFGDLWINGGGYAADGGDRYTDVWIGGMSAYNGVGGGVPGTSGSLGTGKVTLYGDAKSGSTLWFNRADGYTLAAGQLIQAVADTAANLAKTNVMVETTGTGLTLNGGTIDLLNSINTVGGTLRVANSVAGSILNIDAGSTVRAGQITIGDSSTPTANVGGTINQTGGTVTILNQIMVGRYATEASVYNLSGGTITMVNAAPSSAPYSAAVNTYANGGIYVGGDGVGTFNQSGGTVTTPWVVIDNATSTVYNSASSAYNLSGGVLALNTVTGIISGNLTTGAFNFSGGTIRNLVPNGAVALSSIINVTGTGATLDTVDATRGFAVKNDITGGGTLTINGGGTLTLTTTGTQNINATIAGNSGLNKLGTGTTILAGVNTYSGPTTVTVGTLNLTGSINNSDLTVIAGANLVGLSSAKTITFNNNTAFQTDPLATSRLTSLGALTVNGTVTVNLLNGPANANAFPILSFASTNATAANFVLTGAGSYRQLPTFTVTSDAVNLQLGYGSLTWTGAATNTWNAGTTALNFTNAATSLADKFIYGDVVTIDDSATLAHNNITFAGAVTPTFVTVNNSAINLTLTNSAGNVLAGFGSIIKSGTGVLTMASTVANTFSGGAIISNGQINVRHINALGTGTVTLGDANTGAGNTALYFDVTRPAASTYLANKVVVSANGTGTATLGSAANVSGSGVFGFNNIVLARDVQLDANAADRTDFGGITGTGNVNFIGTGRAIVGLVGANTFTGDMTISGLGIVQVGAATAGLLNGIPDNANVIINAGSTLAMSAGSEVIGGLAGAGTVTTNSYVSNLNVGANNADNVFAGTLTQGAGYALSITKIGTGTQTFAGTNTATGTLTVNSGTVVLASTATWSGMTLAGGNVIVTSSQRNSGNITVNSGSTLTLADTGKIYNAAYDNAGVITVNTGGVWTMPNYSYSDVNPGVGQLSNYSARRVLGGGQIIITGDSHSSGQDFTVNAITGGTFAYNPVNAGQTLTLFNATTDNNNINGPLNLGGSGTIVMNETMQGAGSVTKIGTGNLTLGAANTFSGGLVLGPGVVNFNHPLSAGTGTITFGAGSTFDSTGPAGVTFTNSPNLAIAGNLNFVGTQALNLGRGAVTVTGTRTINVGGSNLTIAGNITGTGGLTKTGNGNLSLIGNNTFSGDLTVNAGTVSVGALGAANIGTGTLHLNGGGLRFDYQSLNGFTATGTAIYTGAPASTAITDNFAVLHSSDLSNPDRIGDNTTKGFVGKVYLPAGTFSFSKNFDDQGRLVIGGTTVFSSTAYTDFSTGSFTAATAGWYDIDVRVMNGGGGIGPINGSGIGVGIKLGAVSAVPGDYAAFDVNSVSSLGGRLAPELNRTLTFAKSITLDVNSTLDVPDLGTGSSVNITGVISGASSLTKTGAGTLLLSGANTYTGDTVVSAGILALTGSASASSGVIVNGGTLRIDAAAAVPASGLVFNGGGLQFNLGAATSLSLSQLTINAPVTIDTTGLDVTLTSPLLGNGQLNKAGTAPTPGTLTLATGSSYTGKLGFNGGAIVISDATALGAAPAAFTADSLSFNGGILRTTADVTLDANRGLTLNVNGLGILAPDAATTLTVNAIIASGAGTGSTSGKLALGSTNGGTIVLNGVNTYAGDTDLLGGTVVLGDSAALGTGANLNLPSGTTTATLQLGTTVSGTITKAINVADGFANLTIAAGTKDVTINGGLTGAGTLTQAGTGKLILGGTSAFAGGIVADNTIVLNTANAVAGGALGAILHFGTGTTYNKAGTIAYGTGVTTDVSNRLDTATIPSLTIDTGANTVTFSTSLYGQFEFTKKGSGELILDGLDSFATGNLTLAAGTLTMAKQASLAGVVNGLTFGSPSSLTFTGDATLKYGSLVTTDMSPSLVAAAGKTATIDTNGNDVTFATAINGAGNFAKTGGGTLTLSATNAFTGGFKLAQGTLEIAGANTLTASTGLTFTGDATLKFATGNSDDVSNGLTVAATKTGTIDTNGNDVTFTHSLAGAGTLTKVGTGTLSLDSANTLTGTVNVNAGTLALTAFGSLDTPATIAVGAAGTFNATAPAGFTLASGQTLTGTGAVNVGAANTLAIATGSTLNATGLNVTGKLTLAGTYAATLGAPGTALAPNVAAQTTVGGNVTLGGTLRLTSNSAGAGAYQIINGAGTTTGNFTAFDLVGIDNALLHQVVVKSAGVTGVNLVRVATTTGTLPATIDFGNVRPGASTLSTTRNFANTTTADGFSEALTGSVSANGTGFTTAAAGTTGTVTLALDSLTAGAKTGNANVAVSSVGVGTFANTSLVTGTVALSGSVYDLANATVVTTPLALGDIRRNVTANIGVTNTTVSNATYQDNLNVLATATNANLSFANPADLAAGNSGNVVVTAANVGVLNTTISLGLTSKVLSGVITLTDAALTTQTVALTGTAYDVATATLGSTTLALGNVRTLATGNIGLTNTVLTGGNATYQDNLQVVATSTNAKLAFANPANLAASTSGNVVVTAATAGSLTGTANLALTSKVLAGTTGLNDVALAGQTVAVTGAAYDYGNAVIADTTVAFGNIHLGSAVVTRNLSVANTTITSATYQDNLTATATAVTGLSVNTLSEMAAGTSGNLVFSASSAAAGSLAGSVNFTLNSTNTVSGLDAKVLTTTANVTTTGQVYTGLSTWNATSGSWGTLTTGFGTNWAANQGSPGLDAAFANVDTATFDNTVLVTGATATVSLDGTAPSLKAITFNTTGGGYTLDAGSGGALTLAAGSGNAAVTATAGNHTIATDLTLSTATDAAVGTGAKLTISGAVSGTVGLAKSGAGTLTIAGNNTAYTGAVTLAAGTLELNSFNAIINASALNVTGSATLVYGTGNTTDVSGKLGTIASGTTFTVDTNGNIVTYASAITSAGTLVKDNSGVLVLGAANNLTGPVNVTGGSIRIGNAGALGTSTVTVGAGSFLDLNTIDATGASIVLAGGTLQRPSAYTGTVTFTAASLDASALSSAGANTKVGILAGQTAAINGETRDIELNGGTLTGLSTFAGKLIVKSTLDATATISFGAVTLAGGTINLQGLDSTKSINYQSGTLTNANGYTGNLDVLGAVSVATGTLGNGVLLVGAGDTVTAATNGLNNAIGLSGGTVDFNGKTATSSIAYTNGTLTNAAGYTGDVTFSGTKSFASGSLGSARVIASTGTTLDFAAGFNNAVRNTGGAVTNGTNYTGTMTYAGGQSITVTADQVAKLAFDSGTTAKGSGTLTSLGFAAGSAYTMNIKDGAGVAGVGFDSVSVTGALNLATLSSANRMTLNVVSLDGSNGVGGNIANQTFAWNDPKNFTLFTYGTLTLGNGVTNVADLFTVNYSNFKDKYGVTAQADWFSVSNDTANGAIVLTAIPEPSTYGMSLAGLALALAAIRRRNKRKTDAEAK